MFNALKYSKDLEAAGFSRQQAEAAIDVFFKFMEYNFATKVDIKEIHTSILTLRQEIRQEVDQLRQEVRSDIVDLRHGQISLEHRMTIKFGLMQTAGIAILAAVIKLF